LRLNFIGLYRSGKNQRVLEKPNSRISIIRLAVSNLLGSCALPLERGIPVKMTLALNIFGSRNYYFILHFSRTIGHDTRFALSGEISYFRYR
jgi:hypothetical protein